MDNNVLIFGKTSKTKYITSLLKFCDMEGLKIYVLPEYYCDALEETIQFLKLEISFIKNFDEEYEIDFAIFFTDYINITEVNTLTDYHASDVPMIFINSK